MPLLFAVTLFLSASLLFMVQPMVGKMILPLLGGSPAVWNACMVFFQALLLLGYQYSHLVTNHYKPRRQWMIHLVVLLLPLGAMALSIAAGTKHTPIAVAESLAPSGDTSPFLAVMLLMSVAIGLPFFVASTTTPLIQSWFTYTGHPMSRDPYFLNAVGNAGSLISLLGYPLFIEPNLTVSEQTWVFAVGFALLAVLLALCGRAAANPIGTPPPDNSQPTPKATAASEVEPDPTIGRILKWVVLAFVPSSWMLGVTFYMTTDIASIPLLWVVPLALYLVTFIIAFSRVPPWFRLVIGNLAPVMILLLVFITVSSVVSGRPAVSLLLHILTFFAVAMMCHYELAIDRPKNVSYLTKYFLMMSVGGVLGGLFNALIAPMVFPLAYEYTIVIVIGCLMVPKLTETPLGAEGETGTGFPDGPAKRIALGVLGVLFAPFVILLSIGDGITAFLVKREKAFVLRNLKLVFLTQRIFIALLGAVIVVKLGEGFCAVFSEYAQTTRILFGAGYFVLELAVLQVLLKFTGDEVRRLLPIESNYMLDTALPVLTGFCFWALISIVPQKEIFNDILKMLVGIKFRGSSLSPNTVYAILLFAVPVMACFFYVDRPFRFALAVAVLLGIHTAREDDSEVVYTERTFFGILKVEKKRQFTRLVHGTTLHGTQINRQYLLPADAPVPFGSFNGWDVLALEGALASWDPRQEPLTYYHRTGPVGAMFRELRTRKDGADAKAHVAMVGLGTGSASCYALKDQKLDFYEIDFGVKKLVADQAEYFSYVSDAKKRGATLEFHMGDARLKLKENVDRKYALLLIDAFSSDAIPVHLLTKEAVQLYLDRMTPDGILALHISNKYVRLEPVVAKIAAELGLEARVWNDDSESRPGKTASSWVALARDEATLGSLARPANEQIMAFGTKNQELIDLMKKYGPEKSAKAAFLDHYGTDSLDLEEFGKKFGGQAAVLYEYVRKGDLLKHEVTLGDLAEIVFGQMFHKLKVLDGVPLWTDDYSDVLRVMMLKEVQAVRKFFGLPTPVEE